MSDDDLMFRGASELAGMVRAGEISARELVQSSLDRIEELNPTLNAFVAGRRRAGAAAADEVAPGDERPFAGVPIAIKNNRAVKGLRLTYGCSLMADHVSDYDHNIVRRLKRGGVRDRRHDDAARVRHPADQRGAPVRPDPQPLGSAADPRRLLGRRGGRRGGGDGAGGPRQRRRRLDPHPRGVLRAGGPEAEPRAHLGRPRSWATPR